MRFVVAPLLALALLLATPRAARADGDPAFDFEQARALETAGIGVTTAGVAAALATAVLWTAWAIAPASHRDGPSGDELFGATVAMTVASPLLLAAGIPLWTVGARRAHHARLALGPTGLAVTFQ